MESRMAQQEVVVAAGFLIFRRLKPVKGQIRAPQYLLLQASNGRHHWTPPKGRVDPGESEMEAAFRETEEEAGFQKDQLKLIEGFNKVLHYPAWGKPKKVVYWLSELKDPDTPVTISDEHQAYEWLELEQALDYAKYDDQQKLIKEAHDFIGSWSKQ